MEHCGMVLLGMLKWPKCCHRDFSFVTGQFLISKGTNPLCRASWLALSALSPLASSSHFVYWAGFSVVQNIPPASSGQLSQPL